MQDKRYILYLTKTQRDWLEEQKKLKRKAKSVLLRELLDKEIQRDKIKYREKEV